jgi:hypothetical protein
VRLFHFSEKPDIFFFEPHVPSSNPDQPPMVWAIDEAHAPNYYFPRDCPRVAFWLTPDTKPEDRELFFAHTSAEWVIAIEAGWLEHVRNVRLYKYHLPGETFQCFDANAGYFVSREPVKPLSVEPVGDPLARLVEAGIELRITPSLWKLHDAVAASTLGFSIIRMRNAEPRCK